MNTTAFTDHSGTITAGNTSQEAAPGVTEAKCVDFQNVSDTDMWVNFGKSASATAGGGSYYIAPGLGMRWSNPAPPESVHVLCASANKGFVLKRI